MGLKADTPRVIVLTLAATLAGFLVPGMPIVALSVAAMSLAYLWVAGHRVATVVAVVLSAALVAAVDLPTGALVAVSMFAAGPFAVSALTRRSPFAVALALTVIVFAATVGAQAVSALMTGSSLAADISHSASDAIALLRSSAGLAIKAADIERMQRLLVDTWMASTLQVSAVASLLAVGAASAGAARGGAEVRRYPPLPAFDLDVHVLWLPVVAVASLAMARLASMDWLETVALNALLVSRVPLALQGFGVFGATFKRMGLRRASRGFGYAVALFVELTTYSVSLVGLVDFWANFRRLPRDGAPPAPLRLEEPGASG